jgi:hypothetical protein
MDSKRGAPEARGKWSVQELGGEASPTGPTATLHARPFRFWTLADCYHVHHEEPNDFERQVMLPHKLSQLNWMMGDVMETAGKTCWWGAGGRSVGDF